MSSLIPAARRASNVHDVSFASWGYARMRLLRVLLVSHTILYLAITIVWTAREHVPIIKILQIAGTGCAAIAVGLVLLDVFQRLYFRLSALLSFVLFFAGLYLVLGELLEIALAPLVFALNPAWAAQYMSDTAEAWGENPARTAFAVTLIIVWFISLYWLVFEVIGVWVWQTLCPRRSFVAARGWRPSVWRLLSNLRRHLGVPAFVSTVRDGALWLSVLYLIVSLLSMGIVALIWWPAGASAIIEIINPTELPPPSGSMDFSDYFISEGIKALTNFGLAVVVLFVLNIVGIGRLLANLANRQSTKIYQKVRAWDARRPLVFLRSFDADRTRLRLAGWDPVLKLASDIARPRTLDEVLLEHASPYGPVVAIGDPRDPIPPLGAARIYVKGADADWKNVVLSLLAESALVILSPDSTPGVRWEVEKVANLPANTRVLLLANPGLSEAQNVANFSEIIEGDWGKMLDRKRSLLAAFRDSNLSWQFVTARKKSLQSVTVAVNFALQHMFGMAGVAAARPKP